MAKYQKFPLPPWGLSIQAIVKIFLILSISWTMVSAGKADSHGRFSAESDAKAPAITLTSIEERALGARLAYCYSLRHRQVTDERVARRIERVARRLEEWADVQKLLIVVIEEDRLEAVSFPGGKIFITKGLMEACTDDDKLAAVIAHEAAHSSARHLVRLISEALLLPPAIRKSFPSREQIATGAVIGFDFPSQLNLKAEAFEREADRMAIEWLRVAGYKEAALGEVLRLAAADLPDERESQKRRSIDARLKAIENIF